LSHHVAGWEDTPLCDQLQAAFGAPVSIDNDANVAALGEYEFGAGIVETLHATSLLYVTVSTGVGGGWVIDGKIFSGADGMAGEIGHTVVDPHGPPCVCGRRGCVEAMACGKAIAREARARLIADPTAGVKLRALIGNDLDAITGEQVARAANDGDALARAVIDAAARALGFGIGTAITLLNPARVVIGGGVTKSGERWWSSVRAAARANTLPQMRVDLVPAALGDDAPLWGAIALAEDLLVR
ncbi:MAG TPA: ROK family protein, partial [Anaerolineae bacterium]